MIMRATHPGRHEMAASICTAPMEAVGSGLGKEAVKTTASSQTSFQNLPPAKCSPATAATSARLHPSHGDLLHGFHYAGVGVPWQRGHDPSPWSLPPWPVGIAVTPFPPRKWQFWGQILERGLQQQEQGCCPEMASSWLIHLKLLLDKICFLHTTCQILVNDKHVPQRGLCLGLPQAEGGTGHTF